MNNDNRPIYKRSELNIPICEDCGARVEYGDIPCPDPYPGGAMCLVCHWGWRCINCKKQYDNIKV